MTAAELLPTLLAAGAPAADAAHAADGPIGQSAAWPVLLNVVRIGMAIIILGILLSIYRLMRGPTLADRVLASDSLSIHVLAFVLLLSLVLETSIYLDAALVVALIGFASTVAFGQYIGARADESRIEAHIARANQASTEASSS